MMIERNPYLLVFGLLWIYLLNKLNSNTVWLFMALSVFIAFTFKYFVRYKHASEY